MRVIIFGANGLLGKALKDIIPGAWEYTRQTYDLGTGDPSTLPRCDFAFLCAGTKGFAECEGNRKAFLADVDGNIRLARQLLKDGAFVVFVSTDAVETLLNTAYARNRWAVEMALSGLKKAAIFRPGKFTKENVAEAAKVCASIGLNQVEGLTRWP